VPRHSLLRTKTPIVEDEALEDFLRPRDLAEERWIFELADIYENSFFEDARVWGSGGGPKKHRGRFYRMLEISRPEMFPRAGKLSVRQIDRMLKNRKNMKKQRPFEILNRMNKL
jgi:hypothetical protein